ncbi:IclR family transcriptional regulator [Nocardia testacea]|uniref:IclR family transcriptional regulator n=1 Tax=Nocardia testacea TaxID=248551 RepID=UPI0033C002AB
MNVADNGLPAVGPSALDRGLAILDHLATTGPSTTVELSQALGLSRSTMYRLVDRLHQQGWLAPNGSAGGWRLGPMAARMAAAAVSAVDLKDLAGPALRTLRDLTQETVGLAVPNGLNMVFVQRERGPRPVAVSDELGSARPLHCSSVGRAYLAALPAPEMDAMLDMLVASELSPVDAQSRLGLEAELTRTRLRGWSQDLREFDESSCCCGAAIYDHTGRPIAALSVAGVAERMERVVADIGPQVADTAAGLSAELGYQRVAVKA